MIMPKTLFKIDWNAFKVKQDQPSKAFEDLCYHLFCRKFKLSDGVRVNYNHKGLETDPVLNKDKKLVGFQSKFFENKLSENSSVKQIKDSLKKAKDEYPDIKIIMIYTHYSFGSAEPIHKKEIEAAASPVLIEWFMESNFQAALFKPSNLDLAQLYFGRGSEFLFVQEQLSTELRTFLPSLNYIPLALKTKDGKAIKDISKLIQEDPSRFYMILGNPGSGKSIYLNKLVFELSALGATTQNGMYAALLRNGAIPMLINLRDCLSENIETLIRERQHDNQIRGKCFKFIYLFDGLDELSEAKADEVLSFIRELAEKADTSRIVFSCRTGNMNRLKAKMFLPDLKEVEITELSDKQIDHYFKVRSNGSKITRLAILRANNPALIEHIHDILLLKLLWDTIDLLDETSTIVDLLDQKTKLLIHSPEHKKLIESLNLLNPKGEKILALHEDIAFEFQRQFQFRFSIAELQELILRTLPLQDFRSVNDLVNYLSDLFFENSYSAITGNQTYVYQHRRYQEYFFVKKLKKVYEQDPKVLRQLRVIGNKEFFENFFVPFLRSAYLKEKNLVGNLELNLIDVYLGRNRNFGADNAIYLDSDRFIYAITSQPPVVYEQLINDENLDIKAKLFQDLPSAGVIRKMFKSLTQHPDDYDTEQALRNIWETGVKKLINFCAILHQQNKLDESAAIRKWLGEIYRIYKVHNFKIPSKFKQQLTLQDPFFSSWESWLYIAIVIDGTAVEYIFNDRIRGNYQHFAGEHFFPGPEESGKDKLVRSFLRVCLLYRRQELLTLIGSFDEFEALALFQTLTRSEFLPMALQDQSLNASITTLFDRVAAAYSGQNIGWLFFKKLLKGGVADREKSYANSEFKKLRERDELSMKHSGRLHEFVLLSFVLDSYDFQLFLDRSDRLEDFNHYYDLGLYATLHKNYVQMLARSRTLPEIMRDFRKYNETFTKNNNSKPFKTEMAILLADLFATSPLATAEKKQLFRLITFGRENIDGLTFFTHLKMLEPAEFTHMITDSELTILETQLYLGTNGYYDFIDQCFDLAFLYADINHVQSVEYIVRGINEGILRHGWRKDVIVSHHLVDALEILYRNRWLNPKELKKQAKLLFAMTLKVTEITDGKFTWRGPYHLVDMVAKYDLPLAEKFAEKVKRENYEYQPSLLTSIIKAKINLGYPVAELEEAIRKYNRRYSPNGKARKEYNLERFKVYLQIATSGLYTTEERKGAFNNARKEVSVLLEEDNIVSWDNDLSDEIPVYQMLCSQYNETFDIPLAPDREREPRIYDFAKEQQFGENLKMVNTKEQLEASYETIQHSADGLQQLKTWELVVERTNDLDGNISRLVTVLSKNHYPHSDYYAYSNACYHLALAAALKNLNTKNEMLEYLFGNSGYEGFLNMMKTYEVLRDQETCNRLFDRFKGFCDLLVN